MMKKIINQFFEQFLEGKEDSLKQRILEHKYKLITKKSIDKLYNPLGDFLGVLFILLMFGIPYVLFLLNNPALVLCSYLIFGFFILYLIYIIPRTKIYKEFIIIKSYLPFRKEIIKWGRIEEINIEERKRLRVQGGQGVTYTYYTVYWLSIYTKDHNGPIKIYLGKNTLRAAVIKNFVDYMISIS